jgi:arylsulfatase A-like enzyme
MPRLSVITQLTIWCFTLSVITQQGLESSEGRSSNAKTSADKPNVLFIAVDDLRPELGCYGVDYIQTPRIDAFAKTGRLFRNHYVTAPSCGPSRYALLTGLSPKVNHDTTNHAFKQNLEFTAQRSIESFPHMFKEAGYETLSIGKICHGKQDTLPRSWSRILNPLRNHPDFQNNSGKTQRPAVRGLDLPDAAYQDGAMTYTVIETLRTLGDEPFFFAVGFTKPHLPFWVPKKYFDLYDAESIPQAEWSNKPESPSYHPSFELMQQYGHHPEAGLEDPAYRRHLKHGYAACVSFVDAQIGRILDELEALSLDENTIIVLWGDHGWHLGEHRIFGKHTSFEKALKSVLIMRTPGMKKPGRPTDALVQSIDIYPTLAKFCGLTPPKDINGKNFLDLLNNPSLPGPEYALSYNQSYGPPFRGKPRMYAVTLRSRFFRYIQWQKDLAEGEILFRELYDHRSDPGETNNLTASEPKVIKHFEKILREHLD